MRTRVYVAGPISKGDLRANLTQAREAGQKLLKAGYAPMVPHLTCYWAGDTPEVLPDGTTHEDWMGLDLPWVAVADAVLRLPGESTGADREVALANSLGIPVYSRLDDLLNLLPKTHHATSLKFKAQLDALWALHRKKAADYGTDNDPLRNIRASEEVGIEAWRGAWLRAKDKVKRIDTYCTKGRLANEGVEDSFVDLAAYAIISALLFREKSAS